MGLYQPTYRTASGDLVTAATWWAELNIGGRRVRQALRSADGQPIRLTPGRTWVELTPGTTAKVLSPEVAAGLLNG